MTAPRPRNARDPELRLVEPIAGAAELPLQDVVSLLDELPTGVVVLDARGVVLYLNAIAELRLDRTGAELRGHDLFRDVFPHLEMEGLGPRFRALLDAGRVAIGHETELPTAEGARNVTLGIRSYTAGAQRVGLMLVEDRTPLVREQLRRQRAERLAAVGELAEGVAHEINNPLASIKSFAQLLAHDATDDEQSQGLDVIARESTRIAQTVERLLRFSEQQEAEAREALNLSELAAAIVELKRYVLQTAGVQVRIDLDSSVSPVRVQRGAVQRVLLQLLNHGERALAKRPRDRQLVVQTREATDGVVLAVIDNGPGVPRERLPALLRPSAEPPGKGAQLWLCAALVREQGGRMWAESVEGRGTAFFVQFPRQEEADAADATGAAEPGLRTQAAPASAEPAAAAPPQVLLAETEASLRLAISLVLRRRGYQVTEAESAEQALELARQRRFDVALVDARLAGGGLELLETLDGMPALRGRAALLTPDATHARRRGELRRVFPTLVKPFEMDDLLHTVETLAR